MKNILKLIVFTILIGSFENMHAQSRHIRIFRNDNFHEVGFLSRDIPGGTIIAGIKTQYSGGTLESGLTNTRTVVLRINDAGIIQWQREIRVNDTTLNLVPKNLEIGPNGAVYIGMDAYNATGANHTGLMIRLNMGTGTEEFRRSLRFSNPTTGAVANPVNGDGLQDFTIMRDAANNGRIVVVGSYNHVSIFSAGYVAVLDPNLNIQYTQVLDITTNYTDWFLGVFARQGICYISGFYRNVNLPQNVFHDVVLREYTPGTTTGTFGWRRLIEYDARNPATNALGNRNNAAMKGFFIDTTLYFNSTANDNYGGGSTPITSSTYNLITTNLAGNSIQIKQLRNNPSTGNPHANSPMSIATTNDQIINVQGPNSQFYDFQNRGFGSVGVVPNSVITRLNASIVPIISKNSDLPGNQSFLHVNNDIADELNFVGANRLTGNAFSDIYLFQTKVNFESEPAPKGCELMENRVDSININPTTRINNEAFIAHNLIDPLTYTYLDPNLSAEVLCGEPFGPIDTCDLCDFDFKIRRTNEKCNDSLISEIFEGPKFCDSVVFKYIWNTGDTTSNIRILSNGTYCLTVHAILKGDTCTKTSCFGVQDYVSCDTNCCGKYGQIFYYQVADETHEVYPNDQDSIPVKCGEKYVISFPYTCKEACKQRDSFIVYDSKTGNRIFEDEVNKSEIIIPSSCDGTLIVKHKVYCGDSICDSTTLYFNYSCDTCYPCTDTCDWHTHGNLDIQPYHFIGTINQADFKIRTDNKERMTVEADGKVGINTTDPTHQIHIEGNARVTDLPDMKNKDVVVFGADPTDPTINGELRKSEPADGNRDKYLGADGKWNTIKHEISLTGTNLTSTVNGTSSVVDLKSLDSSWRLTGNSGTNPVKYYLGTKDNVDFKIRTNDQHRMTVSANGRIGIGNLTGGIAARIQVQNDCEGIPALRVENPIACLFPLRPGNLFEAGTISPSSTRTTQFVVTNNGQVGLSPSSTFSSTFFNYSTSIWRSTGAPTTGTFRLRADGIIGATHFIATSDMRLKEDIKPIKSATEIIEKLEGKTYYWSKNYINETGVDNGRKIGFIAQDLEKVLPEAVIKDGNGRYGVEYNAIIPVLVESHKELIKENHELKTRISSLESMVSSYDEKFALLEQTITKLCESGCAGLDKKTDAPILYQSIPNPTDDVALINYYLSSDSEAEIKVFLQEGKTIETFKLKSSKGNGSVKVDLGNLSNGIYLYSLIVDEKVIDTKRLQILK